MISAVLPVYNRSKLEIDHGEGVYLFTKDGSKYLDFVAGVAVNCLGHCHPKLVAALKKQSERLWHISNLFSIPGMMELAGKLTDKTFADSMFFCNSGAEAIECCIKAVRRYHDETGNPEKYRIITFTGAFHGRTLAAIWASKRDPLIQEGFGPAVEGFDNVEFNSLDAVKAAITPETGAILVEPIQGDGGMRVCSEEFLKGLRKIADENGLLLCLDEIQTGMGRTGKLFAHELYGIKPDIMTSAKGIGGGFPLGACLFSEKVAATMKLGTHGSTYGGNPMAMAIGNAVFDEISKPDFLKHVSEMGAIFKDKLEKLAKKYPNVIREIRGKGLMLGIQFLPNNKEMVAKLESHGLLAPAAGDNIVRLLPPLIIDESHIDEAIDILDKVCREF